MRSFSGFPAGKTRFTPIPDLFYTELLPAIADVGELKLTLFMFWFLHRQQGYPRYMTLAELKAEGVLLTALQDEPGRTVDELEELLERAIERAVKRGTLLRLIVRDQHDKDECSVYLFLNTPQGRRAAREVKAGDLLLERTGPVHEAHVDRPRPTIYELYERNIGVLQPLLAEQLQDAADRYPADWIEDAFKIAVARNIRNWRYIETILERWLREGKDDGEIDRPNNGRRHRQRY